MLVQQNGRILLRLEAFEKLLAERLESIELRLEQLSGSLDEQGRQLAGAFLQGESAALPAAPEGLPIGTVAPEFSLPSLAGGRKSLSDYKGRRVLLVFF